MGTLIGAWVAAGVLAAGMAAVPVVAAEGNGPTTAPATTAPSADAPATGRTEPSIADAFSVPEVLVTATRNEMETFATPYMAYVVQMDTFGTNRQYRTTTKALEDVPGVMVQKTSHAQGSPYIRGFTSFRNLMMVDGIRLNNSIFRPGPNQYWNLIDPFTISRLEVVKGPSSVLYGSDAVGGTVNAILRRPEGYGGPTGWYRQLYGRTGTATRSFVGRGEVNAYVDGKVGILVGGTWQHFGDVRAGGGLGRQPFTGYDQCSGDFRIEYRADADTTVTAAHYQFYEDNAWRTHKTVHGVHWHGTTVGSEWRRVIDEGRSLTYLRYKRENLGGLVDAVEVTGSFQQLKETRWRVRNDGRSDRQGIDLRTYGVGLQLTSPSPVGEWTYGAEWYHDEVDTFKKKYNADGSFNSVAIQGPVGDDARYDLLGLYVQNRLPIGEQVEVILGGRYTYARAEAEKVEDPDTGNPIGIADDWDSLVGSARVSWFLDPAQHWNVFGGVSQGFRAPNLSDLTRLDTARSNEIETPSPGQQPEKYISYEVGVKARYSNLAAQASWFITDIEDMIVRTPTGRVVSGNNEVTKKNAGNGYVNGVELSARYRFLPQWTAFGQFAWLYGEVDTYPTSAPVVQREPLSRLAPPTGQLGLRWDDPDGKLWVESVATLAGEADELSTRDRGDTQRIPPGGTPGYFTMDLRGGVKVTEGLDVWAGLENLTNENYRVHGSGVNEPGLNFKFGMKWRF